MNNKYSSMMSCFIILPFNLILLTALIQIIFITVPVGCSGDHSAMNSHEKYRLCGDKLVKVLSVVCRGCFEGGFLNTPEVGKRSEYSNVINWIMHSKMRDKSLNPSKDQTVLGAVEDLDGHGHRVKRGQAGIVDECCIKQCSYSHLRTYCSNDCHWLQ